MYTPDPDEKFDFQNMDVKLYLALKALVQLLESGHKLDSDKSPQADSARRAMYEFTQSFGPIPDWAVDRNWDYSLVPGAQLCTRDGRRTGNAHIIRVFTKFIGSDVTLHECLTDAGSKCTYTESELLNQFTVGDWVSDPARVLAYFDRNGEFRDEQ